LLERPLGTPLYIGLDLSISRDSTLETEIPLSQYAGQTNRLIIMLTSRGATNAVAVVDNLALTQVDDPDGGLLTRTESCSHASGTKRGMHRRGW